MDLKENLKDAGKGVEEIQEDLKKTAEAAEASLTKKAKRVSKSVKDAAEPAAEAVRKNARRVKAAAEPAADAVRKNVKNVGRSVKAATTPAADAMRKAAAGQVERQIVYVQYGGREYAAKDLLNRAKEACRAAGSGPVRTIRLYIKPEEGKAYFVANDSVSGSIEL